MTPTPSAGFSGEPHTAPVVPEDRWRLHRGGVINIWQYAEQVFDLSGGRAIFQGTNGSGKSRTLELLLPLCLDGDLRQLGSKGFDTVSMRRLMLDDYPGGPNRIGYAWIELRRETPDGEEEFLTCGVGVKASRTSQQISDSWRFITTQRVGIDVHLVGRPDRIPLGQTQLRDLLGADCVLDDQAFRAKIAAVVYGVPASRYGDLLHLQRTLRNPDVGLKVLEGQLEQILSDALPPLDSALIERLATSFDDLESIRENIVRLTTADKALRAFLSTYSGYALGALQNRARSMRETSSKVDTLRTEIDALDEKLAAKRSQREAHEQRVSELDQRESELETGIEAMRSHPAYTELQNLWDRERLVEGARSAATAALETASRHRKQEERSVESVLGVLRRLRDDTDEVTQAADRAGQQMTAAGLDASLVPRVTAPPAPEVVVTADRVRISPEPDAEPVEVQRYAAPEVDTDTLATALATATKQAEQAATVAQRRGALTFTLHQQSLQLDDERSKVVELQRSAKQAQLTATDAAGRRNQARQELAEIATGWVEQARRWTADWPASEVAAPQPPSVDELIADRSAVRHAREQVRKWAAPQLDEARQRVSEVDSELAGLQSRHSEREAELAELRAGRERVPARPDWATAERDPQRGAAFYRLVDFRPEVSDQQRAGLEAALQSSGLLNAWVLADGSLADEHPADLVATLGKASAGNATLADVLVPASEPDCPVTTEQVATLLSSVPAPAEWSTSDGDGFGVTATGRWRAGVLSGQWAKSTAEYVGAGAREAARARRIAELEVELSRLSDEVAEAQRRRRDTAEKVTALEQHLESFPDDGDLLTAHAKLTSAVEAAEDAERTARELREQHERAEQSWQAAHAELVRAAGEADLPAETAALEAAQRAATEARSGAERVRGLVESRVRATLDSFQNMSLHHDAAVADRMAAEEQAGEACTAYAEQASALADLRAAVGGGEAEEVDRKLKSMESERTQVRKELPKLREDISSLRESIVKVETQLESKRGQLTGRREEAETAVTAFRDALGVPGMWTAMTIADDGTELPPSRPSDMDDAADAVLSVDTRKTATETAVLNRFQTLQQSLSGSYDITAGEQSGLLTITVTGEEGPRSVADAAVRVSETLAQQRGYLNERYQSIFADYLIRDLAERLRGQIAIAEDLCERMNAVLDSARSSQGVHVQLEWQPSTALSDDIRQAIELVRTPFANRSEGQDEMLRRVFTDLIEAERDSTSGGYAEILSRALDYRSWYAFTVRVRDEGPEGKPRVRRLRQLSSGETRLVSYVTLFAAAAAFYDAVSVSAGGAGPLRLVLLDEAFERLDDPTVARMLGLLVDLDMDWLITWPSGWGVSPKIPRMHIYDVLRPRSGHGIACTHTTWDGRDLERADP